MGNEVQKTGWGAAISGRQSLGTSDSFSWGVTGGKGIGSYLAGFGTDPSGGAPDLGGYRTLGSFGVYAALRHNWTESWFSNLYYGFAETESTSLLPGTAAAEVQNSGINLIWSPRPTFGIGVEYAYGLRTVQSGVTGDNHRIQFTIQFGP